MRAGFERGCVRSISRSAWVYPQTRAFIDRCGWSATQPRQPHPLLITPTANGGAANSLSPDRVAGEIVAVAENF